MGIAALFDELLGEFLRTLINHSLGDQVLIVVTGDHGFRMHTEFESVGLTAEHGDVAFNVPFLLYGLGLFENEIRLPYVTSHVDITPTLLTLTGQSEFVATSWNPCAGSEASPSAHVHDEHKSVACEWLPLERLSLHL